MDVVRSNVERIGGIVEVDSRLGEGTRMTLRVPLTLTIIPALTVSIGGQHFAIPRSAIEEIVRANGESVTLEHLGGAGVATIRGRRVPEVSLADILGLDSDVGETGPHPDRAPAGRRRRLCAVGRPHPRSRGAGGQAGGSRGHGDRPLCRNHACRRRQPDPVVRSRRARRGRRSEARSAGARGADCRRTGGRHRGEARRCCCSAASTAAGARSAWRSSTASRKCRPSAVKQAAGQLRVQLGDSILPLAGARAEIGDGNVRLFRLNDGAHEIGYAFREVIDFASIEQ